MRKPITGQIVALVSLNILSGFMLGGIFLAKGSLFGDTLRQFSMFRDNLHSLNYFGEVAWWNTHVQSGFPMYYHAMFSTGCTMPLFLALSGIFWALGLVGICPATYHGVYVFFFCFLVPLVFEIGMLMLAHQIFRNEKVIFFIIFVTAFSPGVVFNITDSNALEPTAYALFFAAALLRFVRKRDGVSLAAVTLTLAILGSSFGFFTLWWSVYFIPLFTLACFFFPNSRQREKCSAPVWVWICCLLAIAICLLPPAIGAYQGSDILRKTTGTRTYSFSFFRPGNPLEILAIGTPGIGLTWIDQHNGTWKYQLLDYSEEVVGYAYLGVLALPLIFTGLAFGRRVWRMRLLFMILVACAVIPLATYSPFFAPWLLLLSPLRASTHSADATLRAGIFTLLILAAALGLETLLYSGRKMRLYFLLCLGVSIFWSFLLYAWLYGDAGFSSPIIGFILVLSLFFLVAVAWWIFAKRFKERATAFYFLSLLVFLDLPTAAFWHTRTLLWPGTDRVQEPRVSSIGLGNTSGSVSANTLLELRAIRELKEIGADMETLPMLALFDAARKGSAGDIASMQKSGQPLRYVLLDEGSVEKEEFEKFLDIVPDTSGHLGDIRITRETYRSLFLRATVPKESLLFWRDAYFPYWSASVNRQPVPIAKAFGGFKAIKIPAGASEVEFRFTPGWLPPALMLSCSVLFMLASGCAVAAFIKNRRTAQCAAS